MSLTQRATLGVAAATLCLVAILNCGGYRYGIGDQAFYIPAVVQHLNPQLFPRDRELMHAQDRFMLYDEATAFVARVTGIPVPWLFLAGYAAAMLLLFAGVFAIGNAMYASGWTVALLGWLMTLRHRITQTGANTLEAYFQPRMIAFALGVWALASYLRGGTAAALALVAVAFALHPTTALWFGIWIVAAICMTEPRWRRQLVLIGGLAAAAAAWAVIYGPLREHLVRMDPVWASAMAGKDYIFPSDWNASFWVVNLTYLPLAAGIYRLRRARDVHRERELGLIVGAAALLCVFLVSWPLMTARVALALQLQTSRIFWMLDLLAAIYVAWLLAEAPRSATVRRTMVAAVAAIAIGRGVFVWRAEHGGAPLVRVNLPEDSWTDAMKWIARSTPADAYVLADPGHAWKYGTSVRVAGERDVYLEEVKDLALALYSRRVAIESVQRIRDVDGFDAFTSDRLRTLADHYGLDFLVIDRDVDLPVAYRNDGFRIYFLREPAAVR